MKYIRISTITIVLLSIGILIITSCGQDKSRVRKTKSPRIKHLSKVISPSSGSTFKSDQTIDFEVGLSQSTMRIDSVTLNYGFERLMSFTSGKQSIPANTFKAGNQRVSVLVYLSNGKKEKHVVGLKMLASEPPVKYTYHVINTFVHDPSAYTQGLIVDNGDLIESTGHHGESVIKRVELTTGKTIRQTNLDAQYFGEGIANIGNTIYMLTWKSNKGFKYSKDKLQQIGSFTYPTTGWGLAAKGDTLYMSDGTENIYLMEPETFTQTDKIQVYNHLGPVNRLNELEYFNGKIYANIYETETIAIINPESGFMEGSIDLTGIFNKKNYERQIDVLNGIAYDNANDRIYVTGKWWPKLFEIEVAPISETIN